MAEKMELIPHPNPTPQIRRLEKEAERHPMMGLHRGTVKIYQEKDAFIITFNLEGVNEFSHAAASLDIDTAYRVFLDQLLARPARIAPLSITYLAQKDGTYFNTIEASSPGIEYTNYPITYSSPKGPITIPSVTIALDLQGLPTYRLPDDATLIAMAEYADQPTEESIIETKPLGRALYALRDQIDLSFVGNPHPFLGDTLNSDFQAFSPPSQALKEKAAAAMEHKQPM